MIRQYQIFCKLFCGKKSNHISTLAEGRLICPSCGMKVEIRFLPDDMSSAYILYEGAHYPIRRTDRNENCRTKRDNPPHIDYSKLGGDER